MSYAQVHLRSAVYNLSTEEGPIMDRLRVAEDPLSTLEACNLEDIPPQLRAEFLDLRKDLVDALRARSYDTEDARELARRIVKLYEAQTDFEASVVVSRE